MSEKFASLFGKLGIAGIHVAKIILYVISAPFAFLMFVYGCIFIVTGFAWLTVVSAAVCSAILIFVANFYMAFVALFAPSLWGTMGSMWNWLGGWLGSGHAALWPHIVKSFLLMFGPGVVFMMIINLTEWLKAKTTALKAKYVNA